jgi:type IV pilus assembly protein PilM
MSFGIDIGSTALKVISVRRTLTGFKVVGAARRRLPRTESEEQKTAVLRLLHEALGSRNGQRASVVGLSGRDINLQVVQQPAMKPANYRAMMGYELDQRKGEATDLYLDYCTLREPDQFFPQYLALIGIGKSGYIDGRIELLSQARLDVRDAVPNSFALFTAYRNSYPSEGGTVLLIDIGSDNMDLAFVRGGRLIFARNVSSGARIFDQQIAGVTGLSLQEAEGLKVSRGNLGPPAEGEEDDEIRGPVRSAAGQLSGFITSSINHAKMQLNDKELVVDKIYLSGGGARVRGLPEYLTGSTKIPVEILDPFQKVDTSTIEALGGEEFRSLPTDMAVALGLSQLVSPGAGGAASTLSILPDPLKKRRNFFRTTLFMAVGGAVVAAVLVLLTAVAFLRKTTQQASLAEFMARTQDVKGRMDEMETLEAEQRDISAKVDLLLAHLAGGRGVLDVVSRLKKILPKEILVREIYLAEPGASRRDDRAGERTRVAFNLRGRGLVLGELESQEKGELRLRGQEPISEGDVVGDVVRWVVPGRTVLVVGEVDENIRGGARDALNAVKDQLSDASRGVKAEITKQRASDQKPGWRQFEIAVTFE